MSFDAHKNFAYSTVATAPSPASSGTSLVVASGDGAKFPAVPFNATVWPTGTQPTTANAEIVRVTGISTDTLTITRNTATESVNQARSIIIGDQIAATITGKTVTDMEAFYIGMFSGDGSDGAVAFDGTNTFAFASTTGSAPNLVYTLTRDVVATTITVSSGKTVNSANYRFYYTTSLVNSGTIQNNGIDGGLGNPGVGSLAIDRINGSAGAASGNTTTVGQSPATTAPLLGGQGGNGGNSNGGVNTSTPPNFASFRALSQQLSMVGPGGVSSSANSTDQFFVGGTTGGGGGRTAGTTGNTAGGRGGTGGGHLWFCGPTTDNSAGTLKAMGGNGANATTGDSGDASTGGGGGGGGGAITILTHTWTAGTQTVTGGTAGTGLNGASAATNGSTGNTYVFIY